MVSGCRLTSDSVGSMTIDPGVVEIVGVATGLPLISQSSPEIKRTSGLRVAILVSGCRPPSGSGNYSVGQCRHSHPYSGVVENVPVGLTVAPLLITLPLRCKGALPV